MFRTRHMGVSKNRGTPKSSILIGFSIINHPFWGTTIFGNTQMLNPEAIFLAACGSKCPPVERCVVGPMGCGASVGKDPAGSDRNLIVPLESKIESCVFV